MKNKPIPEFLDTALEPTAAAGKLSLRRIFQRFSPQADQAPQTRLQENAEKIQDYLDRLRDYGP